MSKKKQEYRDKSLGHEKGVIATGEHKPNVGEKTASRRQGEGANAFAGSGVVHLQPKPQSPPAISREGSALSTRVRKPNPKVGAGSHTTSEAPTPGISGGGRANAEREKEKVFGYGSGDRTGIRAGRYPNPGDASKVERVEVGHDREWNSKKGAK